MKNEWILRLLILFCFALGSSKSFSGDSAGFNKKELQLTIIKNPGNNALWAKTGWFGKFSSINDELVVVRANGKIVRTFITSTAATKLGKSTPDGYFLGAGTCQKDHTSSIYDSEMDWSMMFCGAVGIHSTTENHYCQLGREASMGCVRLLRSNARELFQVANGEAPLEGKTENFVAKNQLGIHVISGNGAVDYWSALSQKEKEQVLAQAAKNRKEIDAEIKKFKKEGDVQDDVYEGSRENPGGGSSHFRH